MERIPETKLLQVQGDDVNVIELNGVEYKKDRNLGSGSVGFVALYKGTHNNDAMAVKVINDAKPYSGLQPPFSEEAHFLRLVGMLKGKMTMTANGKTVIPMKLVNGKAYLDFINSERHEITPPNLMRQIEAIDTAIKTQLEAKGIEHRDLNLNNIMYDKTADKATVIDFGRAGSSFVTDTDGSKIYLNPYGDRVRFLNEMKNFVVPSLKVGTDTNYEQVEKLLQLKIEDAEKKIKADYSAENVQKMKILNDAKRKEYQSLLKILQKMRRNNPTTKQGWLKYKSTAKNAKLLARELQVLDNYFKMKELGIAGNQLEILKFQQSEANGISNKNILKMNEKNSDMIQSHINDFQNAKIGLESFLHTENSKQVKTLNDYQHTKLDKLANMIGDSRIGRWVNNKVMKSQAQILTRDKLNVNTGPRKTENEPNPAIHLDDHEAVVESHNAAIQPEQIIASPRTPVKVQNPDDSDKALVVVNVPNARVETLETATEASHSDQKSSSLQVQSTQNKQVEAVDVPKTNGISPETRKKLLVGGIAAGAAGVILSGIGLGLALQSGSSSQNSDSNSNQISSSSSTFSSIDF